MGGPSTYYVNDDIPTGTIALNKFSMKTSSDNNRNEEGNSHMIVVNINQGQNQSRMVNGGSLTFNNYGISPSKKTTFLGNQ